MFPDPDDTTAEDPENVHWEDVRIHVRVFLPYTQQHAVDQPHDTSDLIALRSSLIAALKDKQTATWGIWYFRAVAFRLDARRRFVDATLVGKQANEFVAGA